MKDSHFIIQPTSQAIWHHVVKDAHQQSGYQYNEEVENYLVMTLEKFLTDNQFACETVAIKLLEGLTDDSFAQGDRLRDVGDECLLLSGLFPERALKRNVSLSYYIGAGRQAYKTLSHQSSESFHNPVLFAALSTHFTGLMDILHLIRKKPVKNYQ
ncbi:MAG: hypothetical protein P1U63_13040 [Coxiellaceae bacterium]|nr:hypothetical protein [Coxiellaceae bacterium]